ncbi:hypothetical protein C1646_661104 [Rhizophagus diaphanus]|nr:hypothetical protein C1646_661104 [Rhizophagus diaphanus] [Rhizophagus sp. MUCL 43196]
MGGHMYFTIVFTDQLKRINSEESTQKNQLEESTQENQKNQLRRINSEESTRRIDSGESEESTQKNQLRRINLEESTQKNQLRRINSGKSTQENQLRFHVNKAMVPSYYMCYKAAERAPTKLMAYYKLILNAFQENVGLQEYSLSEDINIGITKFPNPIWRGANNNP